MHSRIWKEDPDGHRHYWRGDDRRNGCPTVRTGRPSGRHQQFPRPSITCVARGKAWVTSPDKKDITVAAKHTIYVGAQTGLPRRQVSDFAGLAATGPLTTDYYDYGAKIEITLPPCKKEI